MALSVTAACAFQRSLAAEAWPEPISLRVRAALHMGTAHLAGGDYNSSDVNRCARLRGFGEFFAEENLSIALNKCRAPSQIFRDHVLR